MEQLEGPVFVTKMWNSLFPRFPVPQELLTAWLVMAILISMAVIVAIHIRLKPNHLQNFLEMVVETISGLTEDIAGPRGRRYLPLFITLFLFILCSNLIGLLPMFHSPTANININAALAIVVAITCIYASIRVRGLTGYLKQFCGPNIYLAPLFIIIRSVETITRPLALTMRLFGNMLAKQIVLAVLIYLMTLFVFSSVSIEKVLTLVPLLLCPVIIVLGVLVGVIQAFVFTILTMVYIGEAVVEE